MKLALAGVGPWGRLLARKFQEAGAEIAAYARAGGPDVEGLGPRLTIDGLCDAPGIAGVILATPPDVTLRLARRAAASGLAVLATKPLQLGAAIDLRAPFVVDYVRLWSPFYAQLKARAAGHVVRRIRVVCCGPGPFRSFSSLDDYGPHALAFVHDLLGEQVPLSQVQATTLHSEERRGNMHLARGVAGETLLDIEVGNAAVERCVRLEVEVDRLGTLAYSESGPTAALTLDGVTLDAGPHDPLAAMAAQFLGEARDGRADARFVKLSMAVTRSLDHVRAARPAPERGTDNAPAPQGDAPTEQHADRPAI